jgi:hypothetical protein
MARLTDFHRQQYLKNGAVSTKNNLVKIQWKGCTKCCFCTEQETNQHLFFNCPMARLMWGIVCFTFGITKLVDVGYLLGPWLRCFSDKKRNLVLIGLAVLCWALQISRNDLMFHKSQYKSIFQVMFRGTFSIKSWSISFLRRMRGLFSRKVVG